MDQQTLYLLIDKYFDGTASQEERMLLEEYADQLASTGMVSLSREEKERLKEETRKNIMMELGLSRQKVVPFYRRSFFRIAAAAVIVLMLGGGAYYSFFRSHPNQSIAGAPSSKQTDIAPGHDGAILTLADGRKIVLDSVANGRITEVAVKNGSKLSYENTEATNVEYNTMTTPKGRQFSLVLPDGTQVWLNAGSSITYPTAFTGDQRKVAITGEAYFEVAHDRSKPFHVDVNGMDVQVLGTHFNINSYADEGSVKTTLLEGSVKVTSNTSQITIAPGQQAKLVNGELSVERKVDVEAVMAWKNGYFSFKGADIKTVMRQLSRWYDIDIEFSGAVPNQQFNGDIGRNLSLKEVLDGLAFTSQHFKIEQGRKLIILP